MTIALFDILIGVLAGASGGLLGATRAVDRESPRWLRHRWILMLAAFTAIVGVTTEDMLLLLIGVGVLVGYLGGAGVSAAWPVLERRLGPLAGREGNSASHAKETDAEG